MESECFDINLGVRQGSALRSFLFIIVMKEATKERYDDTFWNLLYVDDLVLSAGPKGRLSFVACDFHEGIWSHTFNTK